MNKVLKKEFMQGDGSSIGFYAFGFSSCCADVHVAGHSGTTRVLQWERVIIIVAEVGLVSNVNAEKQYFPLPE